MKNPRNLILVVMLTSLLLGCSKGDEGKEISAGEQKQLEASSTQNIQSANIPPQAKAAALRGQEMGRKMGQVMNQKTGH